MAFLSCGKWGLLSGCGAWASHCSGLSYCRAQTPGTWASVAAAPGARAQAQWLWIMGSVAPWHVGSSQIRDQTHVSCIGRRILYHWAPEKPGFLSLGASFGSLLMEKGRKSFIVSYFPGSALFLSFSPPLLLLILKQQIPFQVSPEQFHDLLWQPDPSCLNMASALPSFSRDFWVIQMEREMATHSSVLAWRILWTEGPGGLQFTRSQRFGQDGSADTHWLLQRYVKIGKMKNFFPTVLHF